MAERSRKTPGSARKGEPSAGDVRSALLEAIRSAPEDDAPRLLFADWLEKCGASDRATFIRLQCKAEQLPAGTKRRYELERRADAILLEREHEWLGDWRDRLVRWEFRRGFIHAATVTWRTFVDHGDGLFRAEPVYRLGLVDEEGNPLAADAVGEVVAHPAFGYVRSLDILGATPVRPFFGWHSSWRKPQIPVDAWLRSLAAATHVTRLNELVPSGAIRLDNVLNPRSGIDDTAVEAFCRAPQLRTLTALDLSGCPIGSSPVKDRLAWSIAEATFTPRLRRLGLARCGLTERGISRIGADPAFSELRRLDVTGNLAGQPCLEGLLQSPTLGQLTDICVSDVTLPILSRSPLARRLQGLTVYGMETVKAARQAWPRLIKAGGRPRRLHLDCHDPGTEAFEAMRSARWLREVRSLKVESDSQYEVFNHIGAVWRLLQAGTMPRLTRLHCHHVATAKFVTALAGWPGLGRLEQLVLSCDYGGDLSPLIFDSPHLGSRIRSLHMPRIASDEDADRLAGCAELTGLREVSIHFVGELSTAAAERLFASAPLRQVEYLSLHFRAYDPKDRSIPGRVFGVLANPAVLPRLRTLTTSSPDEARQLEDLRHRLGPRLKL